MNPLQPMTPVGATTTFDDVRKWGQELEHLHARIAPRFARPEPVVAHSRTCTASSVTLHAKMAGS